MPEPDRILDFAWKRRSHDEEKVSWPRKHVPWVESSLSLILLIISG